VNSRGSNIPSGGGIAVEVGSEGGTLAEPARRWIEDHARRAIAGLGATGEVRVRVVGDEAMAAAHSGFAGVEGTTDVLTFDLAEPGQSSLDVDILVCIDEARRQAAARGHGVERELLLYIVHGVLHCLGHDDHDPAAAARMHAEEDRILESLGVGATYAASRGGEG
jgi:probable rRNA maturation factor